MSLDMNSLRMGMGGSSDTVHFYSKTGDTVATLKGKDVRPEAWKKMGFLDKLGYVVDKYIRKSIVEVPTGSGSVFAFNKKDVSSFFSNNGLQFSNKDAAATMLRNFVTNTTGFKTQIKALENAPQDQLRAGIRMIEASKLQLFMSNLETQPKSVKASPVMAGPEARPMPAPASPAKPQPAAVLATPVRSQPVASAATESAAAARPKVNVDVNTLISALSFGAPQAHHANKSAQALNSLATEMREQNLVVSDLSREDASKLLGEIFKHYGAGIGAETAYAKLERLEGNIATVQDKLYRGIDGRGSRDERADLGLNTSGDCNEAYKLLVGLRKQAAAS